MNQPGFDPGSSKLRSDVPTTEPTRSLENPDGWISVSFSLVHDSYCTVTFITKNHVICTSLFVALLLNAFEYSPAYATWELSAAPELWIRISNASELQHILEQVFTPGNQGFTWRSTMASYGSQQISAEYDRLIRWDRRHPRDIFRAGFIPRADANDDSICDTALNLRTYVENNHPSVFVSTAQRKKNGTYWTPRGKANFFRYDVYAPGGIDVNPTLGEHKFKNQNEIAFFGGIHRRFIFGATEYDSSGKQLKYHMNPHFFTQSLPYPPRYCKIPKVFYRKPPTPPPGGTGICPAHVARRAARSLGNDDDPMRTEGTLQPPDQNRSCNAWFRVTVHYITFYGSDGPSDSCIEPYGKINAYVSNSYSYKKVLWSQSYETINDDYTYCTEAASPQHSLGETLVLQSTTGPSEEPTVCFSGTVHDWDPSLLNVDDELASTTQCKASRLFYQYSAVLRADSSNYVTISYTVASCDTDDCLNPLETEQLLN